ncbi:isochorismatase family protein [Didymella exigua CBS 183.55]|uniref:Isochorismatase family protein n=1 Tax=Didymella exigua CBS 183.55 TaxID=1150837 RepID=A0A6A5REM0_9PLEO|nr:isochorismatase family protein [Didymella exigua CBS 183.55]KAF1925648.1 isochorismatase family protein [Didymella exigua CBS 183.55]
MASSAPSTPEHRKATIGPPSNSWRHSSKAGFDLSRPSPTNNPDPNGPPSSSGMLTLRTTTSPITLDPAKSALVVIDMQNFFLSPALGRSTDSPGHRACKQLLERAVPAARKAGVRVVWVNWGLTDDEVRDMPAGVTRAFGFSSAAYGGGGGAVGVDKHGHVAEGASTGLGSAMGTIRLSDDEGGGEVDAGRLLMRDTWNADLYPPLRALYDQGRALRTRPDVWVHKNRMSGLWGATTPLQEFLEKEGIATCLFAGVNTDQCVGGTLMDAFSKGFDCVLLSDGSATSSPGFAQECWEYNAAHTFGFCCSCEDLAEGVEKMLS